MWPQGGQGCIFWDNLTIAGGRREEDAEQEAMAAELKLHKKIDFGDEHF